MSLPSQELLQDLVARFISNVPLEEQQSFERLLFLVEQASAMYMRKQSANHNLKIKRSLN